MNCCVNGPVVCTCLLISNVSANVCSPIQGDDLRGEVEAVDDDEGVHAELREIARGAIRRRLDDIFASLVYAVTMGDVDEVQRLLRQGIDIDITNYDARSILHMAVTEGNHKV